MTVTEGDRRNRPDRRRDSRRSEDSTRSPLHLLDIAGLADHLGVTERFIRRLVAQRRIPFCKIGKFVRFDPTDIADWVDRQRVDAREFG